MPGAHADVLGTSAMLRMVPALVRLLAEAGRARPSGFASRPWAQARPGPSVSGARSQVSADTGIGDTSEATAEKGAAVLAAAYAAIGRFLTELSAADPSSMYECLSPEYGRSE